MRILLSNPPWFEDDGKRWGIRAGSRWPFTFPASRNGYFPFPFLMAYATSYLRQYGVAAFMVDSILTRESLESCVRRLQSIEFDWVIIETSSPSIENDLKIAEMATKFSKVALAGPHATVFAEELIQKPFVSAVLKGEYEKNALKLTQTDEKRIYDYDILEDLSAIPYPFRDYNVYQYQDRFPVSPPGPQLQMWGSRGCPFKCIFCLWPPVMYNSRKYRARSAEAILAEIDDTLSRFPRFASIYFDDDTFNIGEERILAICEGMKKIDKPWQAMCRADTCSIDTFRQMKESGCNAVKLGVESGSQRMVDACKKNLNLDTVRKVVPALKKMGIFVHLTFTWGLPRETEEDRQATRDFLRDLNPNSHQESCCAAFPGTPYWEMKTKAGEKIDWKDLDGQKRLEEMR